MNASALAAPGSRAGRLAHSVRAAGRVGVANVVAASAQGRLALVRDPLRMLLFALTILTVSRVHQHYPMLARLRPALLLVIGAGIYAYLNPRRLTRASVLELWPMRLVAVLGVLACCSAVFGISLGRTASFILDTYIKVIAYSFLLAVSIRHVKDLYTFVWAYAASCGILAFFSLFVFGIVKTGNTDFARLSNLYTYDGNDIGVIMMVGFPLTLLLLVSARRRSLVRGILILILLGIAASIARSGSRGGFLGFVAVGVAGLMFVNSVSVTRRVSMIVVALVALALGATPGYWKQMSTVLQPKSDYNYSALYGRKALAERAIGYMVEYPIFGLGMNNFARAECTIGPQLETLKRNGPIRCRPPHNSYLEAGAELGVPGLIVWLSLVFGIVVMLLRLRRRLPKSWRRGTDEERFMYGATSFFPVAMIGFAVTAFFVTFAWLDPLYIMAAFTTGLYIAIREYTQRTSGIEATTVPSVHRFMRGMPGWRVARSFIHSRAQVSHAPNADASPA